MEQPDLDAKKLSDNFDAADECVARLNESKISFQTTMER